jgi:hypothetical protein
MVAQLLHAYFLKSDTIKNDILMSLILWFSPGGDHPLVWKLSHGRITLRNYGWVSLHCYALWSNT